MKEIWKDVKGYEGQYQISNLGNVRSFIVDSQEPRPQRHRKTTQGYLSVGFRDHTSHLIHRLVGKAFLPNPNNLPDIDFIDNNKMNVRLDNLQWMSHRGNCQKDNGMQVKCTHDTGKEFIANSYREAAELTSCFRSSIEYSILKKSKTRNGWSFQIVWKKK